MKADSTDVHNVSTIPCLLSNAASAPWSDDATRDGAWHSLILIDTIRDGRAASAETKVVGVPQRARASRGVQPLDKPRMVLKAAVGERAELMHLCVSPRTIRTAILGG
jgi:hypothetical protein